MPSFPPTSAPASPAIWWKCRSSRGRRSRRTTCCSRSTPRPYQALFDQAQAQVTLAKAKLKLAKADNVRAKNIFKMNPGAMSQQDLDKYEAAEEESLAAVGAAEAALESHRLNLEFTRVTSPIDGQVSRYYLTLGNLVNQDQTLLTTVVSQDPMYAYFDVDEMTMLGVSRSVMAEKRDMLRNKQIPVLMGLEDEQGYPHRGYLDFANNEMNKSTGTLPVRGCSRIRPRPRATGFCGRGCLSASACRSANPARRSWSATRPWASTRDKNICSW